MSTLSFIYSFIYLFNALGIMSGVSGVLNDLAGLLLESASVNVSVTLCSSRSGGFLSLTDRSWLVREVSVL